MQILPHVIFLLWYSQSKIFLLDFLTVSNILFIDTKPSYTKKPFNCFALNKTFSKVF